METAATTYTVKLTAAQVSALECAGLDEATPMITKAWTTRTALAVDPADLDALVQELTEASNSEDASAQDTTDPTMRRQAAGAAAALGNLAGKVRRVKQTAAMDAGLDEDTTRPCPRCGDPLPASWPYAVCTPCGKTCRHGNDPAACGTCDRDGDFAFDAAREGK
jgi:hypothetical protein